MTLDRWYTDRRRDEVVQDAEDYALIAKLRRQRAKELEAEAEAQTAKQREQAHAVEVAQLNAAQGELALDREAALAAWLASGGTRADFTEKWPSIEQSIRTQRATEAAHRRREQHAASIRRWW